MKTRMEILKREFEEELHAKIEVNNLLAIGEIYFPWGTRLCHIGRRKKNYFTTHQMSIFFI